MDLSENIQTHCRTCLARLESDTINSSSNITTTSNSQTTHSIYDTGGDQLRLWLANCGIHLLLEHENQTELPQHMCHNCYETICNTIEFRERVQQAEHFLITQYANNGNAIDAGTHQRQEHFASCRICLRQYPQAVKSLTCQVRDEPDLKYWLEWSCARHISDIWYTHYICRFCYNKLRESYEWHQAARDSAEYLQMIVQQQKWHRIADETTNTILTTTTTMKQEIDDHTSDYMAPDDYDYYFQYQLAEQLQQQQQQEQHQQMHQLEQQKSITTTTTTPPTITIKQEDFTAYPDSDYVYLTSAYDMDDFVSNFNTSMLPSSYSAQQYDDDAYCEACCTHYTNNNLHKNHMCLPNVNDNNKEVQTAAAPPIITTTTPAIAESNHLNPQHYHQHHHQYNHNHSNNKFYSSPRNNAKLTCQQCEKRFNKAILLEAHVLQVHQGREKPFLCKFCTNAYITHTHLKRHLKTAHKDEWSRQQLDDNCSSSSSSQYKFVNL